MLPYQHTNKELTNLLQSVMLRICGISLFICTNGSFGFFDRICLCFLSFWCTIVDLRIAKLYSFSRTPMSLRGLPGQEDKGRLPSHLLPKVQPAPDIANCSQEIPLVTYNKTPQTPNSKQIAKQMNQALHFKCNNN
jgi:hypothetical protein